MDGAKRNLGVNDVGVPLYWMHEKSGHMKKIVMKFLKDTPLAAHELRILRWYVYQWVDAMPVKPSDYQRILRMSQEELKRYNLVLVKQYAIDPF